MEWLNSIRRAQARRETYLESCYVCYQEEKNSDASLRLQENGWLDWEQTHLVDAVNQHAHGRNCNTSKMDLRLYTV